jgi:hypothetical protein
LSLDLARLDSASWRLSWPGTRNASYTLSVGCHPGPPWTIWTNFPGSWPVTEAVLRASPTNQFYRIRRLDRP